MIYTLQVCFALRLKNYLEYQTLLILYIGMKNTQNEKCFCFLLGFKFLFYLFVFLPTKLFLYDTF